MKNNILTAFFLLFVLSTVAQNRQIIQQTPLPYSGTKLETLSNNVVYSDLYCLNWPSNMTSLWKNLQLTEVEMEPNSGWQIWEYLRKYPSSGEFVLGEVFFGNIDYSKQMLYTMTPNNTFIDGIEVNVSFLLSNGSYVCLKQFRISTDGIITIYHLRPTSATPIIVYEDVSFPINAQRIDTTYEIDSSGYFKQVNQTLYTPQNYTEYQFTNENYNIWDGTESILH